MRFELTDAFRASGSPDRRIKPGSATLPTLSEAQLRTDLRLGLQGMLSLEKNDDPVFWVVKDEVPSLLFLTKRKHPVTVVSPNFWSRACLELKDKRWY